VKSKHRCSPLVIVMKVRLLDTLNRWTCGFIISGNLLHVVGSPFSHMVTLEGWMSRADVNRKRSFKSARNLDSNRDYAVSISGVNRDIKFT
jgi:hypothetical protein